MPVFETRNIFSGIAVSEAMRRQVIRLDRRTPVGQGIRWMTRYKTNAVLLTDDGTPYGVVTKTDLMSAFYVQLPLETRLGDVMGNQLVACFPDDSVERALEIMAAAGVHQIYVTGANRKEIVGMVAYADILGLLYRYCRACDRGIAKKREKHIGADPSGRFSVRDVMTPEVRTCRNDDPLITVIDTLTAHRMGAVLINDQAKAPAGVISKSDLTLAYLHGKAPDTPAHEVMSAPVRAVKADKLLSDAIQQMLVWDVQRLFVHGDTSHPDQLIGVLALSDAARFRSGSCRACTAGRMLTG